MYKDREETIQREIGERTVITISHVYIYQQIWGLLSQYDHKI